MEPQHLPSRPNPGPTRGPNTLKRKRNAEDDALQRLMIKREKRYLAQQSAAPADQQFPPFDSQWPMMNPGVLGPHMAFNPPPIHMGFHPSPMSFPHHPAVAPMAVDTSYLPYDIPPSFSYPPHPAPSDSEYRLGTSGTSIGNHTPGDYPTYPPSMGFEWGFNSDDEEPLSPGQAPVKPKRKKCRRSKRGGRKPKKESNPPEDAPTHSPSDMEASEPEEGQTVTPDQSVLMESSASPPHSGSVPTSSSASTLSWSTDETRYRNSPPAAAEPEELVEMARARLKMCVAELKELMGKLDEAKATEDKLKLFQLVKAKDGEIKTAQEAVKIAEAEAEAVKLMNNAVSTECAPAFNDSKLYNQYQGRNPGGYSQMQMSWSRPSNGLPSHLRFLRISSPPCLIIELDDDDDEDW
ncbi:hypothetical protein FS837_003700 [Tulasnella sp. UAMH 9824]|nr:hypothetical protein FS837_003700 [Tulasnella sp. UAMH 9824]